MAQWIRGDKLTPQHYVKVCGRQVDTDLYFTAYWDGSRKTWWATGGRFYQSKEIEILDESAPTFTIEQMKECWKVAEEYGMAEQKYDGTDHDSIDMPTFFKNTHNIDNP